MFSLHVFFGFFKFLFSWGLIIYCPWECVFRHALYMCLIMFILFSFILIHDHTIEDFVLYTILVGLHTYIVVFPIFQFFFLNIFLRTYVFFTSLEFFHCCFLEFQLCIFFGNVCISSKTFGFYSILVVPIDTLTNIFYFYNLLLFNIFLKP